MTRSRRVAARLGAVSAAVALASVVVPGQFASADVGIWRDTNFRGPSILFPNVVNDYSDYRYPGTNINVNDSASSYSNLSDFKIWFFKNAYHSGDNGWSNPDGDGNFGSVLRDRVSSHRPA